jgi:4-diphosphocytidyl-2-C-methyl-D-erythritol kinase
LTKDRGVDRMFSAFLSENDIEAIKENLHNDLQAVVLRDFPVLEQVFSELRKAGAGSVLVSGSGPTVFSIFDKENAIKAADRLKEVFPAKDNWKIFVARTC